MGLVQGIDHDLDCVELMVACRQTLFVHGLFSILRQYHPGWRLADAGPPGPLFDNATNARPDLVLLDAQLPVATGLGGLLRVRSLFPDAKAVVLAQSGDRASILAYLEAGANGYLTTSADPDQVLCAFHTVLAGGIFAPASLSGTQPAAARPEEPREQAVPVSLTGRQREVFELMSQGYATKTIARRLGLAVGTVKVHLAASYRILGVHSRTEAVAKVTQAPLAPTTAAADAFTAAVGLQRRERANPPQPRKPVLSVV